MGNENSTTKNTNTPSPRLKDRVRGSVYDGYQPDVITPPPQKPRVRGSVYRGYQPLLNTLIHSPSPVPTEENPVESEARHSPVQTQLKSRTPEKPQLSNHYHSKQPTIPVPQSASTIKKEPQKTLPTTEQSSPNFVRKTSIAQIHAPLQHSFNQTSAPQTTNTSGFEKAPMMQLNYIAKPSDNKSIHNYGSDNITVLRRTSSQSMPYGNRWYANN